MTSRNRIANTEEKQMSDGLDPSLTEGDCGLKSVHIPGLHAKNVNKDERKTESLTETLSRLMDVYNEMLDVLADDDMTVNPRLHCRMYPTVRAYIRDSCNRFQSAAERLAQLASVQDELDGIECYANGEVDFDGDF